MDSERGKASGHGVWRGSVMGAPLRTPDQQAMNAPGPAAQEPEKVLCVSTQVVHECGVWHGSMVSEERMRKLLTAKHFQFRVRSEVEDDPDWQQIIPYVIVVCYSPGEQPKFLSYQRTKQSGEQRLVGKKSIGIGGHINPCDNNYRTGLCLEGTYRAALTREVYEEVQVGQPLFRTMAGTMWLDNTPVEKVHLGVVSYYFVSPQYVGSKDPAVADVEFLSYFQLNDHQEEYERWSQRWIVEVLSSFPSYMGWPEECSFLDWG
jgi:predicted NUDIX family phosphoesterase